MSDVKCECGNKHLLDYGCTCGYFARVKRDKAIVAKREADEARMRLAEDAIWFSPMPTAGVMVSNECANCNHSSEKHSMPNWYTNSRTACAEYDCPCIEWKRKV